MKVLVDTLATGGEFVCRCQDGKDKGKKAFVRYVAPGEIVSIYPTENKKSFVRGVLNEVIESSATRINPRCNVFGGCGGCDLQHLSIELQRELKKSLVSTTLEKHFGIIPQHGVSLWSRELPAYGYRNRVRLQVSREGRVGFFGAESHTVIPISECPISEKILEDAIKWVSTKNWEDAKQIELRLLIDDTVELRIVGSKKRSMIALKGMPPFISVGAPEMTEISDEFSQVNHEANKALHNIVLGWVSHKEVTDLFAGAGNFSFKLADQGCIVDAVEASGRLVKQGIKAAQAKDLSVQFFEMKCEQYVASRSLRKSVVLDPPRAGADDVVSRFKDEVQEIIYVSCNPTTLGRDLQILTKRGYTILETVVVDMFPQTAHIETVTLIRK